MVRVNVDTNGSLGATLGNVRRSVVKARGNPMEIATPMSFLFNFFSMHRLQDDVIKNQVTTQVVRRLQRRPFSTLC